MRAGKSRYYAHFTGEYLCLKEIKYFALNFMTSKAADPGYEARFV